MLKSLTGFGDYVVNENSLMRLPIMNPPEVVNSSAGFIVRHREYITDVVAHAAFTNVSFALNPGMNQTFPWLAGVAASFESYEWRGLVLEYKTNYSDAISTTGSLGTVIMATSYNANDVAFTNKLEMENYEFANSNKPSLSVYHPVECERNQNVLNHLYVRTGAVGTQDLRMYDLGNFQIAIQGMPAAAEGATCGELWATYEVEFFKPKALDPTGRELEADHFQLSGTFAGTSPLGTVQTRTNGSSLGGTITGANLNVYQFPANVQTGNYLVVWTVTGASTVITQPVSSFTNCQSLSVFYGDTVGVAEAVNGQTMSRVWKMMVVKVTGPQAQVVWGLAGTLPTSSSSGDIWVSQINSLIVT